METKKIEIEVPVGKTTKWVNNVLTLVDDKPKNVMERIKTFEDACNELGDNHPFIETYHSFEHNVRASVGNEYLKDIAAYIRLRIVVAALNEGWEPQFTKEEYRYYPWFCFYTEKEIDGMSDTDRESLFRLPSTTDYGGVSFAHAYSDSSSTASSIGSRLAFKTRELAEYAGKQFIGIWADYIFSTPMLKQVE